MPVVQDATIFNSGWSAVPRRLSRWNKLRDIDQQKAAVHLERLKTRSDAGEEWCTTLIFDGKEFTSDSCLHAKSADNAREPCFAGILKL